MNMDKGKAIESALLQIEKKFGKGSIMRLGERPRQDIGAISTTCLSLDAAIGVGGFPRGRIVEVYGPEMSGKTTLALTIVASAQKTGGICAYIDAEHAMDPEYATKLGVNIDDMLISQPDSGEQALEIAETLIRSNSVDVIVIDSVAALVPRAELDGEMGDSLPGLQARLMSQALRKITAIVSSSNTCFIFINQLREKIGVFFLAHPKQQPAARLSNSTRVSVSTFAVSERSRMVTRLSETAPASKSSKINAPRRFANPNSTSCMAKASPEKAICSILP